jgi:hypothetical protein
MNRGSKLLLALVGLAALPVFYGGLRAFLKRDPFGYFNQQWADPFGGNVGSVMKDVDAVIYEDGSKKASFAADQIEVRRDKQFMSLLGLENGKFFEGGKERAGFFAQGAKFNAAEQLMMIVGAANVHGENFDFKTAEAKVDLKNERIVVPNGVIGTAFKGKIKTGKLELGFGTGRHVAEMVEWKGEPPVQGVSQSREVSFRAARMEFTSDPNVVVYYDAEAIDESALMRAKIVTYDGSKELLTLEGGTEYYGPEAIMTAPKIVVNRKLKKAVASGAAGTVYLLVKPENEKGIPSKQPAQPELPPGLSQPDDTDELRSSKNLRKYPIIVTSSNVEYFYTKGSKRAIITGSPKATQQLAGGSWREVIAPRAEYEEEKELLSLFSNGNSKDVRLRNSAGDEFVALSVQIVTTSGKERMSGKGIEGVMKVRDQEIPRSGGG